MPTPAERKALVFLSGLLVLGPGMRMQQAAARTPPSSASRAALRQQIQRVDSARQAKQKKQKRKKKRGAPGARSPRPAGGRGSRGVIAPSPVRGQPVIVIRRGPVAGITPRTSVLGAVLVDLDRASVAELERLPGVGRVLARRIVANRDSLGPFGSLKALQRVKGIGSGLAKRLAPYVTFSLPPRPFGVK